MIRKKIAYVFIGIILCFTISCGMLNQSIPDYLAFWTGSAQTSKHEFDNIYPVRDGYIQLPSGADRVITYYLVNPQAYTLNADVIFPDTVTVSPGSDYIIEQDASDKSLFYLTLRNNFLLPYDGDGIIISPTLKLTEPLSLRDFGSYSIPIMVNSVPAPVSSPVVLRSGTSGTSKETYVICFNLPDMSGSNINRDIVKLEIGAPYNRTYMVNTDGTLSGGGSEIQTVYNEDWQSIELPGGDDGAVFIGDKTKNFIGIVTDIALTGKRTTFNLMLTDKYGLTSTIPATTQAPKLETVTAQPGSGTIEVTSNVTFSHAVPNATVVVEYSSYNSNNIEVVEGISDGNGKATGTGSVTLKFIRIGSYTITTYAEMIGAADSDETTFSYTVTGPEAGIEIPGFGVVILTATVSGTDVIIGNLPTDAVIEAVSIHGVPLPGSGTIYSFNGMSLSPGTYPLTVIFTCNGVSYSTVIDLTISS